MKKILFILSLAVVLTGCGHPYIRLNPNQVNITEKTQNSFQREHHVAEYTIEIVNGNNAFPSYFTFCMPDDFGNAGDTVQFTNHTMVAIPKSTELEKR
jgi:hypothetical protein